MLLVSNNKTDVNVNIMRNVINKTLTPNYEPWPLLALQGFHSCQTSINELFDYVIHHSVVIIESRIPGPTAM